jgi:hypothetical protein
MPKNYGFHKITYMYHVAQIYSVILIQDNNNM